MKPSVKSSVIALMLGLGVIGLVGCDNDYWTSTINRTTNQNVGQTTYTTADLRAITRSKARTTQDFEPEYVTCAEPSPDVAKIAQAALSADASAAVAGIKGVDAELALALSASRAEGLAQLGQRIATIQLLRDGLYRACEAYANGAIDKTIYATVVSRLDDVMITLLIAEIAGGAATASPLARLTGDSSARGTAIVAPGQGASEATTELINAQAAQRDAVTAEEKAKALPEETEEQKLAKKTELEKTAKAANDADKRVETAKQTLAAARMAGSDALARAATRAQEATTTTVTRDQGLYDALVAIHRDYVDDINFDALLVACLVASTESTNVASTESTRVASTEPTKVASTELTKVASNESTKKEGSTQGLQRVCGEFASTETLGKLLGLKGQTLAHHGDDAIQKKIFAALEGQSAILKEIRKAIPGDGKPTAATSQSVIEALRDQKILLEGIKEILPNEGTSDAPSTQSVIDALQKQLALLEALRKLYPPAVPAPAQNQ